jgi:hypothetical protein
VDFIRFHAESIEMIIGGKPCRLQRERASDHADETSDQAIDNSYGSNNRAGDRERVMIDKSLQYSL